MSTDHTFESYLTGKSASKRWRISLVILATNHLLISTCFCYYFTNIWLGFQPGVHKISWSDYCHIHTEWLVFNKKQKLQVWQKKSIKGGIRLSLAYWTSLYSLSNSHVCGLFVKRNNKDGIDGIIIPLGMYYYLSVALHCNSRTGKRRPNYSRNVKCICKLTNLLRLGTPISKLSKELYVQFFSRKSLNSACSDCAKIGSVKHY